MKRATFLTEAIVLATILLFSLSKANAQSEGPNGHYYEVVLEPNLHWEGARIKAAESTFNGLHGHLATITSSEEDKFIESLRRASGSDSALWVGGSRQLTATSSNNGWFWVNGEGRIPSENGSDLYSNWLGSEPNSGSDSERFLAIGVDNQFGWSSEGAEGKIGGYVVEYPGAGADTKVSVRTIDPFAIENLADPATFEFRRRGNLSLDLPIFFSVSGTAVNGVDYDEISKSIVIPAGESSVRLNGVPRGDNSLEAMETIGVRIEPSLILTPEAAYSIDLGLRETGAVIYEQNAPGSAVLRLAVPRDSTIYPEGEPVVLLAAVSSPTPVERVDFWARTASANFVEVSNKIGSAVAISRTNELAFYRFAWTNPVPGEYFMAALASNGNTRLGSGTQPVRVIVQGPADQPVVRIRSVPLDATTDLLPNADFATGYFEVTRTGSTADNLQVHYSVGGTATAGEDYESLQPYVVIGANRTSAKIMVTAIDDQIPERTESVVVSLIAPTNLPPRYVVDSGNREATVSIIDNDPPPPPPVVSISVGRAETSEAPGMSAEPGRFFFHRTGPTNELLRVFFEIEGTAINGIDYSRLFSHVHIQAGQDVGTLDVAPFEDSLLEGDETVILKLVLSPQETVEPGIPYTIDTNNWFGVVTIHDRPPPPTNVIVSVEATRPETVEPRFGVSDPAELIAPGEFTFRRTGGTNQSLNVYYAVGGTATAGLDYYGLSNRIEFPVGRSEVKANVFPLADNLVEGDETVVVELRVPQVEPALLVNSAYVINPDRRRAVVTIHDRTPQPTNIVVSVEATRPETSEPGILTLSDGPGRIAPGEFTFRRKGRTNDSLNVYFALGGTATAGLDYNGISNRVEFPAGKSEVKANVFPFVDNLVEGDETVVVELTHPPIDSVLGSYTIDPEGRRAVVTIHDTTPQPPNIVVSVEATRPETSEPGILTLSDGPGRIAPGEFTFRRKGGTNDSLNVYFALGGTATAGLDYNGISNRVEFPAGKSEVKANVFPFADNLVEGDETVVVELTHPPIDSVIGSYTIDPEGRRAVVTIHDTTPQPPTNVVVSVEATRPGTSEPGINTASGPGGGLVLPGEFTFRRTGSASNRLNVFVAIGGTATLGSDYGGVSNRVEFPAGEFEVKANVVAFADNLVEGDETVVVELTISREDAAILPIGGYTIDPDKRRAVVTIHDTTPTNLPIVTVEATQPDAWEPSRNDVESIPGEFTIRRSGPTNLALTVFFSLDGTATLNKDYAADTNWVEFLPGETEVVRLVKALADDLVEKDETVVMRLIGRELVYGVNQDRQRATVTIHDRPDTNVPPKVAIVRPTDGATFILGETVRVVVEAGDRDGIAKLELLVDGVVADSVEGPRLEANLTDLALGGHVLLGRAMDNSNLISTSAPVRILIRHRDAVCFVKRNLPETYAPGVTLAVELRATPPEGTHAYAVEDEPPVGWEVGEISHNGVFDPISRKVKFGPYTDSENRLLTYRLTPPANASGRYSFTGNSSVNGALYPICGDETLEPMQQYHPADINQNFTIVLSEVTAYAAAWKAGDTWPVPPNPIPLNYVTRAAMIWRRGEQYIFDPSQGPAPACWVPSGGSSAGMMSALAVSTAERTVPDFQPGIAAQIQVAANPPGTAASYAIEEKPPRGWTVANISHDGVFDSDTGVIRWGVFFDATPRTLTYTLTPPAGVSCLGDFSGQFSHDGSLADILSASVVSEASTPIQITGVAAGSESVSLEITGPAGQTAVIESSSDFVNWIEVQSIFIPDGEIGFKTEITAPGALFYRLRVR